METETITTSEPVETTSNDVVADSTVDNTTSDEVTTDDSTVTNEVDSTVDETQANSEPEKTDEKFDYEKSYKELQANHTKIAQENADFRKKLETFEANQPKEPSMLDSKGNIDPKYQADYNYNLALGEINSYKNLAGQLEAQDDVATVIQQSMQAENALRYGDVNAYNHIMNEIKQYFSPQAIELVNTWKNQVQNEMNNAYAQEVEKHKQAEALRVEEYVNQMPKLKEITNPDSEYFSQDLMDVMRNEFHTYGSIDTEKLDRIYNAIEGQVKRQIQAKNAINTQKQKVQTTQGQNVGLGNNLPSAEVIDKLPQAEFNKLVDKFGINAVVNAK